MCGVVVALFVARLSRATTRNRALTRSDMAAAHSGVLLSALYWKRAPRGPGSSGLPRPSALP